jgi:hypothetical protein
MEEIILDFEWHAGFAKSQAQRSIASLHAAARERGLSPVLEISSKSDQPLGVSLSAFNLTLQLEGRTMTVESVFQGSKVFEGGGPFHELYEASSRDAKTDERIRSSGRLIGFNLFGQEWPTEPLTLFYDWLYISALDQHPDAAREVLKFSAFSDIAFNPEKSLNCQARSAAVYVALKRQELIAQTVKGKDSFLALFRKEQSSGGRLPVQRDLFSDVE